MSSVRTFTKKDAKVLAMLDVTAEKVRKITETVDPHKRFNREDSLDPYGVVIEWLHFTGTKVFRD
jgi:hypothetical protein